MGGTHIVFHGLSFESALKIITVFDEYTILNKRKKFFSDGELDMELKEGYYKITSVEDLVCIEEIKQIINDVGKTEWKVECEAIIKRNSFAYMEIK